MASCKWALLWVFTMFSVPLLAQESEDATPPEVILPYSIKSLLEATSITENLLAESARRSLADSTFINSFKVELDAFLASNPNRIESDSLFVDYSNVSLQDLNAEKDYWHNYNNAIDDFQARLKQRIDPTQEFFTKLMVVKKRWAATQIVADTFQIDNQVKASIATYVLRTTLAEQKINRFSERLLVLNAKLANEKRQVLAINEYIIANSEQRAHDVFSTDAEPLFKAISQDELNFGATIKQSWLEGWPEVKSFFKTHSVNIVLHALFVIFLVFLLIVLNRKFKKIDILLEEQNADVTQLISFPILSALTFGLLLSRLFYPEFSTFFSGLLFLLAIVPIVYLLPIILKKGFKGLAIFLVTLIVLNELASLAVSNLTLQRLILFVAALVMIVAIVIMRRNRSTQNDVQKGQQNTLVVFVVRMFALVLFFAIIANIFGSAQLAVLLTVGSFYCLIVGILVFISVKILQAILVVTTQTGAFGKSLFIQKNQSHFQTRALAIINILGLLFWVRTILTRFAILNFFTTGYNSFLMLNWQFGEINLSVQNIASFFIIILVFYWIAKLIDLVAREEILPRVDSRKGFPLAMAILSKYAILMLGFVLAMAAAGISLNKLNLLVGALGVGIGFGLQNIISNLVSGLVILFERPIHIGDVITAGQLEGEVLEIGLRSSRVRTWEGAEVIVPNNNLTANEVTNWTFSDKKRRVERIVFVDAGPSPRNVKIIIDGVLKAQPELLNEPTGQAYFLGYENNALKFRLLMWMDGNILSNPSETLLNLHEALTANGCKPYIPVQRILVADEKNATNNKIIGAITEEDKETEDDKRNR